MRICWIALATVLLTACGQEPPVPADPPAETLSLEVESLDDQAPATSIALDSTEMPIQRVDSLMISRLSDRDETVLILAAGSVTSDGWTDARLEPVASEEEGPTRSFQFLATSPEAATTDRTLETVEARLELSDLPPEVETIRVIAQTNELTAFVGN